MRPANANLETLVQAAEQKGLTVLEIDARSMPVRMTLAPDKADGRPGEVDPGIRIEIESWGPIRTLARLPDFSLPALDPER